MDRGEATPGRPCPASGAAGHAALLHISHAHCHIAISADSRVAMCIRCMQQVPARPRRDIRGVSPHIRGVSPAEEAEPRASCVRADVRQTCTATCKRPAGTRITRAPPPAAAAAVAAAGAGPGSCGGEAAPGGSIRLRNGAGARDRAGCGRSADSGETGTAIAEGAGPGNRAGRGAGSPEVDHEGLAVEGPEGSAEGRRDRRRVGRVRAHRVRQRPVPQPQLRARGPGRARRAGRGADARSAQRPHAQRKGA